MKRWSIWLVCMGSGVVLAQEVQEGGVLSKVAVLPAMRMPAEPPQVAVMKVKESMGQFNRLLDMPAEKREETLARKAEKARAFLRRELDKYDAMTEEDREAALQSLRVWYYLRELVKYPAAARAEALNLIPESDRAMVSDRLRRWDVLPADLQKEVLENERTIRYVLQLEGLSREEQDRVARTLPDTLKRTWGEKLEKWHDLPADRRQRVYTQFLKFFELSPKERAKIMETLSQESTLSQEQRERTEESLKALEKLTPEERAACLDSFRSFVETPPSTDESYHYLETLQRWRAMSAKEKGVWKSVIRALPPIPVATPPIPGTSSRTAPIGTNRPAPALPGVAR